MYDNEYILQCNALSMTFPNPKIFAMKVIIVDWNSRFNIQWYKK